MINILNVPKEQLPGKIIFQSIILVLCIAVLSGFFQKFKLTKWITPKAMVWGALILMTFFIIKNVYAILSI